MPLPEATVQPAARTFLRDRAYEALFEAVQTGRLLPGEVLRDDELMGWLGMSRTPIRHALIRLAESGLIEMSAGRQTTVAELAPDRTNRALFVSAILNEYAVRRVLGTDLTDVLAALAEQRDEVRRGVAGGDGTRIARGASAFFAVLARRVGNRELDAQLQRIDAELARFLAPGGAATEADIAAIEQAADALYDAASARDGTAALAALWALYQPMRRDFLERFREPEVV